MPFLLSNPALLLGLLGLGVPVLIHLLLRRQRQKLRFPTTRFFVPQELETTEKRKLRNLLLLALRLLIFALLVFAFARPYLPSNTAGADGRPQQRIVVIDRTASVNATSGGETRWNLAMAGARKELAGLRDADRAALVSFAESARVDSALAPREAVGAALDRLTPSAAAGDLAEALREAGRMARTLTGDPTTTEIVIISDLQKASVQALAKSPMPEGVRIRVVAVGESSSPNTAITDLALPPDSLAAEPVVSVAHFGEEKVSPTLSWKLDGKEGASVPLSLEPGGMTNFPIRLTGIDPGWHEVSVRLDSKDALALDNVRHLTFWTPPPFRIWLAEPRPNPRSFKEASFFLAAALDPSFGVTNRSTARYSIEKVKPTDIPGRLSIATGLNRPDVILLPAMGTLPASIGVRLTEFVKSGGGVWFFSGDELAETRYPLEFNEILPAMFKSLESLNETNSPWRLTAYEKAHPMLAPFVGEASAGLRVVEFRTRRQLAVREPATVLARYEDDVPLLVTKSVGEGRVLLANFGSDTKWSDWPKHKSFVPMIRRGVEFLAGRSDTASFAAGSMLVAGSEMDIELGLKQAGQTLTWTDPAGNKTNRMADAEGRWPGWQGAVPGIHVIRDAAGQVVHQVSVNMASAESDLAGIKAADLEAQVVREGGPAQTALTAGFIGETTGRREAWRWLLLAAFVLLLAETVIANRVRS